MKRLPLFIMVWGLVFQALGASYCVGPSATGDGSGSDWNNQLSWADNTPERGDTWYLRAGSYAEKYFDIPTSGTELITIKKASPSEHVTDTGWQAAWGTNPAYWTTTDRAITLGTGYLVFDGSYRNETNWFDGASYGFCMTNLDVTSNVIGLGNQKSEMQTNITIKYVHIQRGNLTPEMNTEFLPTTIDGWLGTMGCWDSTFSHLFVEAGYDVFEFQNTRRPTIEYCAIWGTQANYAWHGNPIDLFFSSMGSTVRYNILRDIFDGHYPGSIYGGATAAFSYSQCSLADGSKTDIYGNILDGFIGVGIETGSCTEEWPTGSGDRNVHIYNNTFVTRPWDCPEYFNGTNMVYHAILVDGTDPASTQWIYNNLFVTLPCNADGLNVLPCSGTTIGNNYWTTDTSVFVDYAGRDLHLTRSVGQGFVLPAPYDTDMESNSFNTASGFTIGAYALGSVTPNTNATLAVSPTVWNAGMVLTNTTLVGTIQVRNSATSGSEALVWSAWVVGGGGAFSLTLVTNGSLLPGAAVSIHPTYSPKTANDSCTIIVTNATRGGSATITCSGQMLNYSPWPSCSATSGAVVGIMAKVDDYIVCQSSVDYPNTIPDAKYYFNVTSNGMYTLSMLVLAPDGSANSLYWNINSRVVVEPTNVWDLATDATTNWQVAGWRGAGRFDSNQFLALQFWMDAGSNTLEIYGRESGVRIYNLQFTATNAISWLTQPVDTNVQIGTKFTFTAAATNNVNPRSLSYQWYKASTSNGVYSPILGAIYTNYVKTSATNSDAGYYKCRASLDSPALIYYSSVARLTVVTNVAPTIMSVVPWTIGAMPVYINQVRLSLTNVNVWYNSTGGGNFLPSDQNFFKVVVSGSTNGLHYQWRTSANTDPSRNNEFLLNPTEIAGATNNQYYTPVNAYYDVVVTNLAGKTTNQLFYTNGGIRVGGCLQVADLPYIPGLSPGIDAYYTNLQNTKVIISQ